MLFSAILIGLFAAFIRTHEFSVWVIYCSSFLTSSIVGAILGNFELGVQIGVLIQLVYMGAIVVGGVSSYSYIWAGVIGPAVAIVSNLEPDAAVTVAVTVGALGIVSDNLRLTLNSTFVHMADKYVETGETKRLWVYNLVLPFLLNIVLYGIPAVIAIMFGATYLEGLMNSLPAWFMNSINAVGKLLPALGIGMMFKVVYNKKFVAFGIIGYLLTGFLGVSTMGVALFAVAFMLLYWGFFNSQKVEENSNV